MYAMRTSAPGAAPRSTLLAFNTVERLFRGDFFHSVTEDDVRAELDRFPPHWTVVGLGTTNWHRRNGEVLIGGNASAPTFAWADPQSDPPGATMDLRSWRAGLVARSQPSPSFADQAGRAYFPFAAVAVCDPSEPSYRWTLDYGEVVHAGVSRRCEAANVGLAGVEITGRLRSAACQAMCHLPIGGVSQDRPAAARSNHRTDRFWNFAGFYSANPTIRSMLAHESAAVHLHGRDEDSGDGGHLLAALAGPRTEVTVRPLRDLIVRIPNLDVAGQPVRALG